MKSRLIILLLALTTAGCSTIPTSTMPITMQSGKPVPTARIYQAELTVPSTGRSAKVSFLRDAGFLGGACTHKIFVDGKTVFAIRAGEFQTLHLAPGRHAFALEIEGGVCPAFSTSHSTVLADGAEETYRIFVPPLISPTLGTTIAAGPPQVQIVARRREPPAILRMDYKDALRMDVIRLRTEKSCSARAGGSTSMEVVQVL